MRVVWRMRQSADEARLQKVWHDGRFMHQCVIVKKMDTSSTGTRTHDLAVLHNFWQHFRELKEYGMFVAYVF